MDQKNNIDKKVVSDFGKEWKAFNHQHIDESILDSAFDSYFHIFPFSDVKNAEGFDMGCGSGRWAKFVAPQVGLLHCIDPSEAALDEARVNMKNLQNCSFECAGVDNNILKNESQDFGYSLGVLHHIPDTSLALESCSKKLKSGAPFLLYLYYRFDNKPKGYYFLWKLSDIARNLISRLPFKIKYFISTINRYIYLLSFSTSFFIVRKNWN